MTMTKLLVSAAFLFGVSFSLLAEDQKITLVPAQAAQNQQDPHHLFEDSSPDQKLAFQQMTRQAMPLTPEQILQLKEMRDVTQRAAATPVEIPPKPTLSTQAVNLSPGALPPVIRLQQGFVTSVVFLDNTGGDWPVESYDLGNSKAFNIQWQRDTNTLMIQALGMYTYGNLAVKLKKLSTPVMLTLVPGQQMVDYRIDLRIQQAGPNAKPFKIGSLGSNAEVNDTLLGVLDGVSPQGAVVLRVVGGEGQAWRVGEKLYLRTHLTVLSPGWQNMMESPDGMRAYELTDTSTLLISNNGIPAQVKLEE